MLHTIRQTLAPSRLLAAYQRQPSLRLLSMSRAVNVSDAKANADAELDVVVIGGGPGGYVAAIKAAQLGLKVACVEKRGTLGGTCLNVGCIPSKALLNNSHLFHMAKHDFENRGIKINGSIDLDLPKLMNAKDGIVKSLTSGIEMLLRKNKITYIKGEGCILSPNEVQVTPCSTESKPQLLHTRNIIIATGSTVIDLPFLPIDEKKVVTSSGALAFEHIPKSLAVVGGGVIGLELGSVWARLGSKVTIVEAAPSIGGAGMDSQIAAEFHKTLVKDTGLMILTSTIVRGVKPGHSLQIESKGVTSDLECDCVLVAVGRKPYTTGLGLERVGVALDSRGRIEVDRGTFQTVVPNIYAIGDAIDGPMLAHKAEEEGIAVAENIAKPGSGHVNYEAIPSVVYTHPEVAWVGLTEQEVKASGEPYNVGIFPFMANSRAKANADTTGLVKIIAHKETDRLLGAHIIGPNAGEMIAIATLAIEYGAASEDIARTCHAHPTLSEAFKEACLAAHGNKKAIHF